MRKNNTYNIFLDDSRNTTEAFYKFNNPIYRNDIVTIKNYKNFVDHIETQFTKDGSYPGFISFDYQLSNVTMQVTEDKTIFFNEECYQETGLECAVWIINFCKKHNLPIPKYFIHDDNTYGKRKITKLFTDSEKVKNVSDPFETENVTLVEEPTKLPIVETVTENEVITVIEDVVSETQTNENKLPFARKEFFVIVKDYLNSGSKSREELNAILITQFPENTPMKHRMTKINNLLAIYKIQGKIENIGTRRKSLWVLTENQKVS
jgi:hypothetical protein